MKRKLFTELNILDDFMFKKVLEDKVLCKRLLSILLQKEIKDIDFIQGNGELHSNYDNKKIVLDLYIIADGVLIDVEMQQYHMKHLPERIRYYKKELDGTYSIKGKQYKDLKDLYILFICNYDVVKDGRHVYDMSMNLRYKDLFFDRATTLIYNIKYKDEIYNEDLKAFLDYCNGIISNNEFVQQLHRRVQQIRGDEKMNQQYFMSSNEYFNYIELAEQEGMEKGIEKGMEKGIKSTMIKNAKGLLSYLDDNTIASIIGLTVEEVKALRNA